MSTGIVILKKIPAPLIVIGIWILSSQSTLPQPKGIFGFDKIQHFVAYCTLAVTTGLWFSLARWQQRPVRNVVTISLISALYGAIDEIHQYYVPGRDCNIWDWIADTLGAVIGALAVLFVCRMMYRKTGGRKVSQKAVNEA
jgi:VanZ family protein